MPSRMKSSSETPKNTPKSKSVNPKPDKDQTKANLDNDTKNDTNNDTEANDDNDDDDENLDPGTPPTTINPYRTLSVSKSADPATIKSAYRKAALRTHPDKVPASSKATATRKFQEVALAYAVLSDPRRRQLYDNTGRISSSLDDGEDGGDGFAWADFYRAQFAQVVTPDAIAAFRAEYQGSEEEALDVIEAYVLAEGDMRVVMESVMCAETDDEEEEDDGGDSNSNINTKTNATSDTSANGNAKSKSNPKPKSDLARFRALIDAEIAAKRVPAYEAYGAVETSTQRARRKRAAAKEAEEAREAARELGVEKELFGDGSGAGGGGGGGGEAEAEAEGGGDDGGEGPSGKKGSKSKNGRSKGKGKDAAADMTGLQALIQKRQEQRQDNFFANLEAKYAPKGKGKRRMEEEPPEEAFQKTAARATKKTKRSFIVEKDDDDDDDEADVEEERPKKKKRSRRA